MLISRNRSRQGKTSEENEAVVTYGNLTESKFQLKNMLKFNRGWVLISRNFARLGAPRNAGDGVVTYSEPSIAGATTYREIYTISIASPKEKNRYFVFTAS